MSVGTVSHSHSHSHSRPRRHSSPLSSSPSLARTNHASKARIAKPTITEIFKTVELEQFLAHLGGLAVGNRFRAAEAPAITLDMTFQAVGFPEAALKKLGRAIEKESKVTPDSLHLTPEMSLQSVFDRIRSTAKFRVVWKDNDPEISITFSGERLTSAGMETLTGALTPHTIRGKLRAASEMKDRVFVVQLFSRDVDGKKGRKAHIVGFPTAEDRTASKENPKPVSHRQFSLRKLTADNRIETIATVEVNCQRYTGRHGLFWLKGPANGEL